MHYMVQLYIGVFLSLILITFFGPRIKLPIAPKLLFIWSVMSSFSILMAEPYKKFGYTTNTNLKIFGGYTLAYLLIFTIAIFIIDNKTFKKLFDNLVYLVIFGSIIIIYKTLIGSHPWALALNSSTEGSFLASVMPLVLFQKYKYKKYLFILPLIAVFLTKSSIGIGGTVASILIYTFFKYRSLKTLVLSAIFSSSFFVGAYFYIGPSLFSDTTRVIRWKALMKWWHLYLNPWLGSGLGTYLGLGMFIERLYLPKLKTHLPNAHNDWLQILFELGLIGFILALISAIQISWRAYKDKNYVLLSSFLTFCIVALMNQPLRYVMPTISALMAIRMIYQTPKEAW